PYVKGVACNVTMLTRLKVTIIGNVGRKKGPETDKDLVAIARGDSESWRLAPKAWVMTDGSDVKRLRLFVGEGKIVGALGTGDETWSRRLKRLTGGGADISPIRPQLLGAGPAALRLLVEFYRQWESAQRAASAGRRLAAL